MSRAKYQMVCVVGCGDEPAVIRGSKGTIEFNEVPFENRMKCGWNIQLYDNRVTGLRKPFYMCVSIIKKCRCHDVI